MLTALLPDMSGRPSGVDEISKNSVAPGIS